MKKQEGSSPIDYILMQNKTEKFSTGSVASWNIKGNKKDQQNYTRASSHEDICCLALAFALSITNANSPKNDYDIDLAMVGDPWKYSHFAASKYTSS